MSTAITEEILQLRERAYELALRVLDDATQRATLGTEARTLQARLRELRAELQSKDPKSAAEYKLPLSEAWLDLSYVEQDTHAVSLRLGREVRQRG